MGGRFKHLWNKLSWVSRKKTAVAEPEQRELSHRYAVVTAVHNCEPYLKAYFQSLSRDIARFGPQIRVVLVDDGSTDHSCRIIRRWVARFPASIFLIRQENGGQSSARNAGIDFVAEHFRDTDWITFIDADDFVDRNYFARVDKFAAKRPSDDLRLISCNLLPFDEASGRTRDNHPLRYRFAARQTVLPMKRLGKWMQLSVNSAFFHFPTVRTNGLMFDERIQPCFEDAHFVGRYMHWARDGSATFLAYPRYHYRKRSDHTSSMDKARASRKYYLDVLEHGCLDLIDFYREHAGGRIPQHVQRSILYHCCNYISWGSLMRKPDVKALQEPEARSAFLDALDRIFAAIDDEVIHGFELADFTEFHEAGVLNCFKGRDVPQVNLAATRYDASRHALQVRYFTREVRTEEFHLDGHLLRPISAKTVEHRLLDRTFILERRIWLPLGRKPARDQVLEARLDPRRPTCLSAGARPYINAAPLAVLQEHAPVRKERSRQSRLWLLMDRDTQADDNAEHLYRYIRAHDPDQPIRFVLSRSSHDWQRLADEGFDLVEFGSDEHEYLLTTCDKLISSHVDAYVVDYFKDGGLRSKHTVFLQHGVISADLSAWLNPKPIDCFVTSSPAEYESICGDGSRYVFTRREVALTGLPRHDALVRRSQTEQPERLVLVMPTWRSSLVGKSNGGNARQIKPGFAKSHYAEGWRDLLSNDEFIRSVRDAGYRLALFPHANLEPYIDQLGIPEGCEIIRHCDASVQDLLLRASVLITDYSSVAFDMALLNRSVIYYQFDRDRAFAADHIYQAGHFDYVRDGFGPVCSSVADTTGAVTELLQRGGALTMPFRQRAEAALPFRDGECCARVHKAIRALDGAAATGRLFALEEHRHVRTVTGRF